MADTSRFDKNITTAAVRLHDPRTMAVGDPAEASYRYSLALLSKYQNFAIRDTVREAYLKFGDGFEQVMPEMVNDYADVTITDGVGNLPLDAWIVLEVAKTDYSWYAWRVRENVLKVLCGRDAMLQPTLTKPAFYQTGLQIRLLPNTLSGLNVRLWYIRQPADITAGPAAVIPVSPMWDGEIVARMVQMGIADAKSSIAV